MVIWLTGVLTPLLGGSYSGPRHPSKKGLNNGPDPSGRARDGACAPQPAHRGLRRTGIGFAEGSSCRSEPPPRLVSRADPRGLRGRVGPDESSARSHGGISRGAPHGGG